MDGDDFGRMLHEFRTQLDWPISRRFPADVPFSSDISYELIGGSELGNLDWVQGPNSLDWTCILSLPQPHLIPRICSLAAIPVYASRRPLHLGGSRASICADLHFASIVVGRR